jgi:GTP:adenosylcobinamide-phosphate guanylyltransferase
MSPTGNPVRVIVLAAQRPGVINPLAARFGVSHKCLVPLAGKPLIAHVLAAISKSHAVGSVAISVEPDSFETIDRAVCRDSLPRVEFMPAASSLADSVLIAAGQHAGPLIVTTADHALLDPASITRLSEALSRHDVVFAMAPREAVMAAHPDGQRRFYRFRGGQFSNCNLYGISGPEALRAAEIFRGGGQFAKRAGRIIEAFGLLNLMLLRLRMLSLPQAARRISSRIGLNVAALVLDDGNQAIDVDNDRTYSVVAQILTVRHLSDCQPLPLAAPHGTLGGMPADRERLRA